MFSSWVFIGQVENCLSFGVKRVFLLVFFFAVGAAFPIYSFYSTLENLFLRNPLLKLNFKRVKAGLLAHGRVCACRQDIFA